MINQIQLQNFKCFRELCNFEFSKLNLLTGINGRGKSSLLQSILLLSQSIEENKPIEKLKISGKHISLGNFNDVKNSETRREELIIFKINFDNSFIINLDFKENEIDSMTALLNKCSKTTLQYNREYEITNDKIKNIKEKMNEQINYFDLSNIEFILFFEAIRKIHYISADRLGPVKYIDKVSLADFLTVGSRGEYTINILAKDNLPSVNKNLYLGKDADSVIQQTEEWLSYILDGAKIEIRGKEISSSVLYMLLNNKTSSYNYKPNNVGFGYSYVLPLIVTGLIAQQGDTIIIENPEAHLHPKAQSRITEFFGKVASCGVQVFIESHSEHILNGIRICALKPEINITNNDLSIYYFNDSFEPEKLLVNEKGKIDNWPLGFFDQQEFDLSEIFKYSR